MIRRIAPQFFTAAMAATLAYYKNTLGIECVGTWGDTPWHSREFVVRDCNGRLLPFGAKRC